MKEGKVEAQLQFYGTLYLFAKIALTGQKATNSI